MTLELKATRSVASRWRLVAGLLATAALTCSALTVAAPASAYTSESAGTTCIQRAPGAAWVNSGPYGIYGPVNIAVPEVVACRTINDTVAPMQLVAFIYNLQQWNGYRWQTLESKSLSGWIPRGQSTIRSAPGNLFIGIPIGTYQVSMTIGWYNNAGQVTGIRSYRPAHWGDINCGTSLPATRCYSGGSYAVVT